MIFCTPIHLFGNFKWNSSHSADIDLNGSLISVSGDFTIFKTSGQLSGRLLTVIKMKVDYNAFDANINTGISYSRIKVQKTTGKIIYSKVLSISLGKASQGLGIYPNPVSGYQLTFSLSNIKNGQYSLWVVSIGRQNVYKQMINRPGTITQTLNLPAAIKPGVYNLVITGGGDRENKLFIIQ